MIEVVKLGLGKILLYFIMYIILHFLIIKAYNEKENMLLVNTSDEKLLKQVKLLKFFKNWFPAIYVIILILLLM